ncbi:MAG: DUF3775 domain-containing protein [Pseudomonadota bacterium]
MPELTLSSDFLNWLVTKAHEFDVKDASTGDADDDDQVASILEDRGDDPVFEEMTTAIEDLNERQQIELVALAWLGRAEEEGSGSESFEELFELARNERVNKTSVYLLGMPLLSDYLLEGMNKLGIAEDA